MKEFNKKFRVQELLIAQVGAWNISLRPQQPTVGSLVLSLARKCDSFADLTEVEAVDLGRSFKVIERLFDSTFKPQKINYLALMMVDNQVHYHVLPRYKGPVSVDDQEYHDKCWPVAHDLKPLNQIGDAELGVIYKKLKEQI